MNRVRNNPAAPLTIRASDVVRIDFLDPNKEDIGLAGATTQERMSNGLTFGLALDRGLHAIFPKIVENPYTLFCCLAFSFLIWSKSRRLFSATGR
jgi:hypothetical protein